MAFLNGVCGRPGKAATVKIGKISNGQQIGVVNSGTETEAVLRSHSRIRRLDFGRPSKKDRGRSDAARKGAG